MTLFSPLMLSMENPYRVLEPREIRLGSEIFHMEKVRLVKRIEKKKKVRLVKSGVVIVMKPQDSGNNETTGRYSGSNGFFNTKTEVVLF